MLKREGVLMRLRVTAGTGQTRMLCEAAGQQVPGSMRLFTQSVHKVACWACRGRMAQALSSYYLCMLRNEIFHFMMDRLGMHRKDGSGSIWPLNTL
eukprot:478961-Pelagomonas_calceolata.AAC.1